MMIPFRFLATTAVLILASATVYAQTGVTPGGSGQNGLAGGSAGSSTTGSSSNGGSTSGQNAATGSGLTGQSAFGGTVPGQSTAVSNATQTFIGSNATQGFIGGASQATNQQGNNRQFQAIQNNQSQQNSTQQTGTPREVRTTLRVGFSFPSALQSQQTGRLANANVPSLGRFLQDRPGLAGINVAMNSNGVAVLTGAAPGIESSRLAANLMRLQPGVRKVDNQITLPVN